MATGVLENFLGVRSLVLVNTEDPQGVEIGMFELSLNGTLLPHPLEHVLPGPEDILPVVGDVGEDSPQPRLQLSLVLESLKWSR